MGAARKGRSSVVVGGREYLYSFDDSTGHLHVVSADKRFVVRDVLGRSSDGTDVAVVIGRECPAVAVPRRPLRIALPPFEHAYSLRSRAKRLIAWCMTRPVEHGRVGVGRVGVETFPFSFARPPPAT